MSKKKRRLPPMESNPRPLIGPEVESITVGSWVPSNNGTGKPLAVAISIKIKNGHDIVLRIKTPEMVDEIIQMLLRHKRDVWPTAP